MNRRFIALDGEGMDLFGVHTYTLLATSDGEYIEDYKTGISTRRAINFLLSLAGNDAALISFYFSYDVNMILKGLEFGLVKHLAKTGATYLYDVTRPGIVYKIEYQPKKFFTIREGTVMPSGKKVYHKYVTIYDVSGYFQTSFVNALAKSGIKDEFIERMKLARSNFTPDDKDEIRAYCIKECQLLVELMNPLRDSLESLGFTVNSWHGPGAVASAAFRRYGVKSTIVNHAEIDEAVRYAYFGGRIQTFKIGVFGAGVSSDIRSAYPWAMSIIPSFEGSHVVHNGDELTDTTLCRVTWEVPADTKITPFPVRTESGRIMYPLSGTGIYWYPEVRAAINHFGPDAVAITETWQIVTGDKMAFPYVSELFDERNRLKAAGDTREKALKLVLNSGYGKLAQSAGFMGRKPAFQCYALAGLITSYCRARILEAIAGRDDVIAVATDGVLSERPIAMPGPNLGDWEADEYERLEIYKPGTFRKIGGGKVSTRVRGFRSIDFDTMLKKFERDGLAAELPMSETRFIGMRSAHRAEDWRTWVTGERVMKIVPFGYDPEELPNGNFNLLPPFNVGPSLPYTSDDAAENKILAGVLEEDLSEDGYE